MTQEELARMLGDDPEAVLEDHARLKEWARWARDKMAADEATMQQQSADGLRLGQELTRRSEQLKAYQAVIEGWRPAKVFRVGSVVRFGPGQKMTGKVRSVTFEGGEVPTVSVGWWTPAGGYAVGSFPQDELATDDTLIPVEVVT